MRMDDRALVEAVRAGRTELFARLVDRHAAAVFRLIRAAIRQEADAEDIAQEVFLASFAALGRLRDPGRFRAHLLSITARKVADHLRRKQMRAAQSLQEEPAAPPPNESRELVAAVERELAKLPPEARLIFALRHHEGLSCVQIARILDLPQGTVYSRISRTHAAIRRAVEVSES
ncbi:MAG: RNA polymerase sigma factor [Planctomycetota bacterium]|jgi:RNA polymerase sigma-70 factor (ECF subfamily)